MREVTALGLQNLLSGQFLTTMLCLAVMSSSNRSYAMRVIAVPARVSAGDTFSGSVFGELEAMDVRSFSRINVVILFFSSNSFVF